MDHPDYVEGCYACKIKTMQWGIVPGGTQSQWSESYYDDDILPDFPNKEEVMDNRSDFENAPIREMKVNAETGRIEED